MIILKENECLWMTCWLNKVSPICFFNLITSGEMIYPNGKLDYFLFLSCNGTSTKLTERYNIISLIHDYITEPPKKYIILHQTSPFFRSSHQISLPYCCASLTEIETDIFLSFLVAINNKSNITVLDNIPWYLSVIYIEYSTPCVSSDWVHEKK